MQRGKETVDLTKSSPLMQQLKKTTPKGFFLHQEQQRKTQKTKQNYKEMGKKKRETKNKK